LPVVLIIPVPGLPRFSIDLVKLVLQKPHHLRDAGIFEGLLIGTNRQYLLRLFGIDVTAQVTFEFGL
jgi:hypothetical protein